MARPPLFRGPARLAGYREQLERYARNPTVLVELNSRCNFHCFYCRSPQSERQKSFMSREVFLRVLDQLPDITTQPVRFHVDGEPTLHPRFREFAELANARGFTVSLATNGTGLKPELLDLSMGLQVNVSTSREELARRSSLGFGPYLKRLMRYVQAWRTSPSTQGITYKIFTTSTDRQTPGAVEAKLAFARNLVRHLGLEGAGTWADERGCPTFRAANGHGGCFALVVMAATEGGLYPGEDGASSGVGPSFGFCDAAWKTLAILSDGTVAHCCVDVTGQTAYAAPPDVMTRSLRELWFDDPVLNARRERLLAGEVDLDVCRECLAIAPNREHYMFPELFPLEGGEPFWSHATHAPRPAPAKEHAIVLANCVGGVIADLFRRYPGFSDQFTITAYENFSRPALSDEELSRCRLFIYQPLSEEWGWGDLATDRLLARLPRGCSTVSMPSVQFLPFWPFYSSDRRNKKTAEHPHGKYFYGDSYVLDLLREGKTTREIVDTYMDCDVSRVVDLDALLARELGKLRDEEKKTDVRVADFIAQNLRTMRLFNTVNHPRNPLLALVFMQALAHLGLPRPAAEFYGQLPPYFGEVESPIHPSVARHFGLTWAGEDTRYSHWGKPLTFREFIEDYVEFR